jgi:hypothetical protein
MTRDFNGTWTIDLENSTVWDPVARRYVADEVGEEVITMRIQDGVQDYEVLYGDGPTFRMGYTSRYDDPTWVPYVVREVTKVPEQGLHESVEAFRRRIHATSGNNYRNLEVGKPYGLVRTVYSDERTHYRLAKDPATGLALYVMPRRLAEDGRSYVATILNNEGIVSRVRRFVRVE